MWITNGINARIGGNRSGFFWLGGEGGGGGVELVAIEQPTGLWGADEATFTSASGWTDNGGVTIDTTAPGEAQVGGTQANTYLEHYFDAPLSTSGTYGVHIGVTNYVAGRYQMSARPEAIELIGGNNYIEAHRTALYEPSGANTVARFNALSDGGNAQMDIVDAQFYDLTDFAAQPRAIILQIGGANRSGVNAVSGYDIELDKPEFRAFAVPTFDQANLGADTDRSGLSYGLDINCGIGIAQPATTPLPSAATAPGAAGASPVTMSQLSEAKYLCDNWRWTGYTPTLLLSAASGTTLATDWDHTSSPQGPYLQLLKDNVDAMIADNASSFVAGAVIQIGEDELADYATYAGLLTGFINDLRAEYGNFPVVIAEIGGKTSVTNVANMIAEQEKLDRNSGEIEALDYCAYVARPDGDPGQDGEDLLEDEAGTWVHYRADTNRTFGTSIATALASLMALPQVEAFPVSFGGSAITYSGSAITF